MNTTVPQSRVVRAPDHPRRRVRPAGRRGTLAAYAFLSPAAVLFLAFFVVPAGYAALLSLRASTVSGGGIGVRTEHFIGLGNYQGILHDPEFWDSLVRMLGYAAIVVPVMLGLALLFALLLDSHVPAARAFSRISIFLPYAVPGVLATLLWGFLYLPNTSPFNDIVTALGGSPLDFLTGQTLYPAVANVAVWGGTGFNMVVLYTSLRALNPELADAARIDGCGEWQLALRVKIPLLTPALVMTGVFSTITTLQVFSEPMTLRPLTNAISSTWMPMMKVYRDAFTSGDPYSAAAESLLIAAVTLVLSLAALRLLQNRAFGEER